MVERIEQISTLQGTDWNEEWKLLQRVRRKRDDSQYWNKRSNNFDTGQHNPYVEDFLRLAAVGPGESVFDMGCGTGTLAVPLAQAGHEVVAADFSSSMLEQTGLRAQAAGVRVKTLHLAWDDNWKEAGLRAKSADVAFASRSIATDDMAAALAKLTWIARRKCCVTLSCGSSPRMDPRVLSACGIRNLHGRDHQYAWNILVNAGFAPSVAYIRTIRRDTFDSLDAAAIDFGRMIDDVVDASRTKEIGTAKGKLRSWLEGNLVANPHAGEADAKGNEQGALVLREPRVVTWAFISWEV